MEIGGGFGSAGIEIGGTLGGAGNEIGGTLGGRGKDTGGTLGGAGRYTVGGLGGAGIEIGGRLGRLPTASGGGLGNAMDGAAIGNAVTVGAATAALAVGGTAIAMSNATAASVAARARDRLLSIWPIPLASRGPGAMSNTGQRGLPPRLTRSTFFFRSRCSARTAPPQFSGVNFAGAYLYGGVSVSGATMPGVDFAGAYLTSLDLSNVRGKNLAGAGGVWRATASATYSRSRAAT